MGAGVEGGALAAGKVFVLTVIVFLSIKELLVIVTAGLSSVILSLGDEGGTSGGIVRICLIVLL
jgi:hypothetical protein